MTKLGKREIFLGYSWLIKHNPKINWVTKRVEMTQCPTSECGLVERHENTKWSKGPVSPKRASMEPTVSILEQGSQIPYDPDMAVREEIEDDEIIYSLTREAENELPKEI